MLISPEGATATFNWVTSQVDSFKKEEDSKFFLSSHMEQVP